MSFFLDIFLVKSNTAKENAELRSIIKILWPRTGIKLLNKVVPKPDCKFFIIRFVDFYDHYVSLIITKLRSRSG